VAGAAQLRSAPVSHEPAFTSGSDYTTAADRYNQVDSLHVDCEEGTCWLQLVMGTMVLTQRSSEKPPDAILPYLSDTAVQFPSALFRMPEMRTL
jgi:hypothetical protein